MKIAVLAGLALIALSISSVQAAQCVRSCTNVKNVCVKMGASEAACSADMANCMRTGNLHMPSGRTFSNLCKK
jgi:hypothetical protein